MAIFIDKRPKLDKRSIILLLASILILLSGLKGCNSDYAKAKNDKSNVQVLVTDKAEEGGLKSLYCKAKGHEFRLSVTDSTYAQARIGRTMNFMLSRREYEGEGWIFLFIAIFIIGMCGCFYFTPLTIITIIKRYF